MLFFPVWRVASPTGRPLFPLAMKLEPAGSAWGCASNDRRTDKMRKCTAISIVFGQNQELFMLSSAPYTAYRAPAGHDGLRGPAVRYRFLIPRRRRDG